MTVNIIKGAGAGAGIFKSSPVLRLKLQEPYFEYIKVGKKTIEGRVYEAAKFSGIKAGDLIEFYDPKKPENEFTVSLVESNRYSTFKEMLEKETLEKTLPGIDSIEKGVQLYHSFPGFEEQEKLHGVIALSLKILNEKE